MKTLFALVLLLSTFALTTNTDAQNTPAQTTLSPVVTEPTLPQDTPDATSVLAERMRTASYDDRSRLAAAFDGANRQIDVRVGAWRADGMQASAEAETALSRAREETAQKFSDLTQTTEETWETARDNALVSLQKLRGAVENYRISRVARK